MSSNKPSFYFTFEMKLELIPYIEEEVAQFLSYFQKNLDNSIIAKKLYHILHKKLIQIESFHYRNWNDLRISQIITSKNMLLHFLNQNQSRIHPIINLSPPKHQTINPNHITQKSNQANNHISSLISTPKNIKVASEKLSNTVELAKADHSINRLQNKQFEAKKKEIADRQSLSSRKKLINEKQYKSVAQLNAKIGRQKVNTEGKVVKKMITKQSSKVEKIKLESIPQKKMTKEEFIQYLKNKQK